MSTFLITVTWLGSILILLPVTLGLTVWLHAKGRKGEGVFLWVSLAGASVLAHLFKLYFARPRPPALDSLISMPGSYAFPSAHTAQAVAFALACTLICMGRKRSSVRIFLLSSLWGLTFLVAFSRIYLRVHYLSDVTGGAALAIIWVAFVYRLLKTKFAMSDSSYV